jgi:AbiV family abortive infection protein
VDVLTPDQLLCGAFYALEHAGRLLTSAALLLEHADYPTAAALALYAREEMGRHRKFMKLRGDSMAGQPITAAQVKSDHVERQAGASGTLHYRLTPGDPMERAVRAMNSAAPGSPERKAAYEQIELMDKRKRKRQPHDREEMRVRALYVDPGEQLGEWSRPADLDCQKCADEVTSAIDDYQGTKMRFEEQLDLASAIALLVDLPVLPEMPSLSIGAMLPRRS